MQEKSTKFKDKVILITNIESDAGMHTAVFCAEQGASLVLNCSNKTDPYLKSKILSINNQVLFTTGVMFDTHYMFFWSSLTTKFNKKNPSIFTTSILFATTTVFWSNLTAKFNQKTPVWLASTWIVLGYD